jgi:leader peptidase (prepilin peptidase) / N-methyltransferase
MRVADVDPNVLRAIGAVLGIGLGLAAGRFADVLPRRYAITHVTSGPRRSRRNRALVVVSSLSGFGIAQVLVSAQELSIAHALFLLTTNAILAAMLFATTAIDLEHMILPNELTIGATVICLASSPLRSIGFVGSIAGAVVGFLLSYVPSLLYKKLRGRSGMGFGDAKLTAMAGAWHGIEGAIFVLFAGALQSTLAAVTMRVAGLRYEVPESVKAEIAGLRARADAGDAEARDELADDPMAAELRDGVLGMRLPLGPFLTLACVEVLFLRRWLVDHVLGWLAR